MYVHATVLICDRFDDLRWLCGGFLRSGGTGFIMVIDTMDLRRLEIVSRLMELDCSSL